MKNGIIITIALALWGVVKLFFKLLKAIIQVLSSLIVFLGLYIPLFYLVFGIVLLATTSFTFGGTGTDQVLYYIGLGFSCVAAVIISIRNVIVRPISSVFAPLRDYRDEMRHSREDRDRRGEGDYPEDRPQEYEEDYRDGYSRRPRDPYRDRYADEYGRATPDRYAEDRYSERNDAPYGEDRSRFDREERREAPYYTERPAYRAPRPPYGVAAPEYAPYDRAPYEREPRETETERPLIYYSRRRPGVLVKEYSDRFELFEENSAGRRYIGTEYKDE